MFQTRRMFFFNQLTIHTKVWQRFVIKNR